MKYSIISHLILTKKKKPKVLHWQKCQKWAFYSVFSWTTLGNGDCLEASRVWRCRFCTSGLRNPEMLQILSRSVRLDVACWRMSLSRAPVGSPKDLLKTPVPDTEKNPRQQDDAALILHYRRTVDVTMMCFNAVQYLVIAYGFAPCSFLLANVTFCKGYQLISLVFTSSVHVPPFFNCFNSKFCITEENICSWNYIFAIKKAGHVNAAMNKSIFGPCRHKMNNPNIQELNINSKLCKDDI